MDAPLWATIRQTPDLDWLLLTKRPTNIRRMLPVGWGDGWDNVWLGTTVEHQDTVIRAHQLGQIEAKVRFLSAEPLLGPVRLETALADIHWVIAGGESGPSHRQCDTDWIRDIRDQCGAADTAFLFKQYSGPTQKVIKMHGRLLDGVEHNGYPDSVANA